jgi:hypothetical protein
LPNANSRLPNLASTQLLANPASEDLVIALHPQTPKHKILGAASQSHYTDTSEPVDGNGVQNNIMVNVLSGFRIRDLSISGPTRLPTVLTGPTHRQTTVAMVVNIYPLLASL